MVVLGQTVKWPGMVLCRTICCSKRWKLQSSHSSSQPPGDMELEQLASWCAKIVLPYMMLRSCLKNYNIISNVTWNCYARLLVLPPGLAKPTWSVLWDVWSYSLLMKVSDCQLHCQPSECGYQLMLQITNCMNHKRILCKQTTYTRGFHTNQYMRSRPLSKSQNHISSNAHINMTALYRAKAGDPGAGSLELGHPVNRFLGRFKWGLLEVTRTPGFSLFLAFLGCSFAHSPSRNSKHWQNLSLCIVLRSLRLFLPSLLFHYSPTSTSLLPALLRLLLLS